MCTYFQKGFKMKSTFLSTAAMGLGALMLSGVSAAATLEVGDAKALKVAPASGCYFVNHGFMAEQSADAVDVVGKYKFLVTPTLISQGPAFVIAGPLSGIEGGAEELARRAARANRAEEEGPHGHHVLGTDDRIGTLKTEGDSIEVTGVSCIDDSGAPRIIQGVESLSFVRGTGVFSKLVSGKVNFKLTYNACNAKNNPVANLEVIQGELCFQ